MKSLKYLLLFILFWGAISLSAEAMQCLPSTATQNNFIGEGVNPCVASIGNTGYSIVVYYRNNDPGLSPHINASIINPDGTLDEDYPACYECDCSRGTACYPGGDKPAICQINKIGNNYYFAIAYEGSGDLYIDWLNVALDGKGKPKAISANNNPLTCSNLAAGFKPSLCCVGKFTSGKYSGQNKILVVYLPQETMEDCNIYSSIFAFAATPKEKLSPAEGQQAFSFGPRGNDPDICPLEDGSGKILLTCCSPMTGLCYSYVFAPNDGFEYSQPQFIAFGYCPSISYYKDGSCNNYFCVNNNDSHIQASYIEADESGVCSNTVLNKNLIDTDALASVCSTGSNKFMVAYQKNESNGAFIYALPVSNV